MNKIKRPVTIKKIVIQSFITIVLLFFAVAFVSVALDAVSEEEVPNYRIMRSDIQGGAYGRAVDYYDTVNHLYGVDEPEYAQYTEFVTFYREYLRYMEYSAIGKLQVANECLKNIRKICDETQYFEMKSHYEYILGTIK